MAPVPDVVYGNPAADGGMQRVRYRYVQTAEHDEIVPGVEVVSLDTRKSARGVLKGWMGGMLLGSVLSASTAYAMHAKRGSSFVGTTGQQTVDPHDLRGAGITGSMSATPATIRVPTFLHTSQPPQRVSMLPTALVHVGPHKTGTTYIQTALWKYQAAFRGMNILYAVPPRMGQQKDFEAAHHFLVRCDLRSTCKEDDAKRVEVFWRTASEAAAGNQHLVISSEAARAIPQAKMVKLKARLRRFNVKIVYVYRDLLSWLYSDYRQLLWVRQTVSVFSKFSVKRARELRSELFNSVRNYIKVFGYDNVFILDYLGSSSGGDILDAMLSVGSLPNINRSIDVPSSKGLQKNKGLNQEEVLLRQLWALFEEHLLLRSNCTLSWPVDPLVKLVEVPEIILDEHVIPTVCLDIKPLRHMALKVDREFRNEFGGRIRFGHPDLARNATSNFPSICELDLKSIRSNASDWQMRFKRQESKLPHGACIPGRGKRHPWKAHGRI